MAVLGRVSTALVLGLVAFAARAEGGDARGGLVVQGNTTFRLWGVYVPDLGQVCEDGWPAGKSAADLLARLTSGGSVVCDPKGDGRDTPRAAVCKVGGKDLAEELVRTGMAWARLSDGTSYVVPEADALSQLLGVHGHMCRIVREKTLGRE